MPEPIEMRYFKWLCSEIDDPRQGRRVARYKKLLVQLQAFEFHWSIPGDDNRYEDCLDLRLDFLSTKFVSHNEPFAHELGYSTLEVLVAFSRRASFQTDLSERWWFWVLVENLGLIDFRDDSYPGDETIERILERFVFRTYTRKGHGGLFPLRDSKRDQRDVEIWYQFFEYLDENGID